MHFFLGALRVSIKNKLLKMTVFCVFDIFGCLYFLCVFDIFDCYQARQKSSGGMYTQPEPPSVFSVPTGFKLGPDSREK